MGQNDVVTEGPLERVRRLSEAVRRSQEAHRDTLAARNGAIREAYAGGKHEAELAQAAGLTRQAIIGVVCQPDPEPGSTG